MKGDMNSITYRGHLTRVSEASSSNAYRSHLLDSETHFFTLQFLFLFHHTSNKALKKLHVLSLTDSVFKKNTQEEQYHIERCHMFQLVHLI